MFSTVCWAPAVEWSMRATASALCGSGNEAALKRIGVLSQVVPKPSDSRSIASVEARTACGLALRNILPVVEEILSFLLGMTRQCIHVEASLQFLEPFAMFPRLRVLRTMGDKSVGPVGNESALCWMKSDTSHKGHAEPIVP